jgi:AcrR family transcriptional regulator
VAAEAGVGKATIYRRWPGKERLVLDAVREVTAPVAVPDTGDLRGDLAAFTAVMAGEAAEAGLAQLLPGLAAAAVHNPDLRRELVAFAEERRAHVRGAFERAVARGEVRAGVDLALAVEQVVGPVVSRLVIAGEAPQPEEVGRMVDHLLAGIGTENRRGRGRAVR